MASWPAPARRRIRRLMLDLAAEVADAEEGKPLTRDQAEFLQCIAREASDLLTRTTERAAPKKALRTRAEGIAERKAERVERVAAIRGAVMCRAGGACEACDRVPERLELDHWHGAGARRALESAETCWLLCPTCHRERTLNRPTAEHWNGVYESHCKRNRLPFKPHKIRDLAPRRPSAVGDLSTPARGEAQEAGTFSKGGKR